MKKLIIAAVAAATLCGCGVKVEDDKEVNAAWTYHGRDVCTKIVEIDGHKYILIDGTYSGNIIHAASCWCMGK